MKNTMLTLPKTMLLTALECISGEGFNIVNTTSANNKPNVYLTIDKRGKSFYDQDVFKLGMKIESHYNGANALKECFDREQELIKALEVFTDAFSSENFIMTSSMFKQALIAIKG